MSIQDRIGSSILSLKLGAASQNQEFTTSMAELAGKTGTEYTLTLITKNSKIEDPLKNQLIKSLRTTDNHVKAIRDSKKTLSGKQLLASIQRYQNGLRQTNEAILDLENAGCCGTSSKVKDVDARGTKVLGYQMFFQALRSIESNDMEKHNEAVERVRAEVLESMKDSTQSGHPLKLEANPYKPSYHNPPSDKLADIFLGLTLQENPRKVMQLLPKQENNEWIYGRMHEEGRIYSRNPELARQFYEKGAARGQAEAMYRLGCIEQKDIHNSRNIGDYDFIELWEKAAELGHLEAIADLGFLYEKGLEDNVQPNLKKAHEYYLRGAKEGFPRSMNNLASLYMTNPQLRPQLDPITLLQDAAELGYSKAYLNLAVCYQKGKIVSQDSRKAANLFRKGAEKGDEECKLFWVYNLINGSDVSQEDWIIAQQYCLQAIAADPDKPEGFYFLGLLHEDGLGCNKELQTAFLYFLKAARLKYPAAVNKVGDFYHSGVGVQQNKQLAVEYYMSAAEMRSPDAMLNLAYIHEDGYGGFLKADNSKALEYFQHAAELGSAQGNLVLGEYYQKGHLVRKDASKAEEHMRRAAALGSSQAQTWLSKQHR